MEERENWLEIYRQRYETFRYLDNLHWFMLQIAVGGGAVATTFLSTSNQDAIWWHYVLIGTLFTAVSVSMLRIKSGARANNIVLREFGQKIGDTQIPENKSLTKSGSHWVTIAIMFLGLASIVFGLTTLFEVSK